jgi:hypothetical protein
MARKLWKAGGLIFGDKWIMKHGEVPAGEWGNVLLAFDEKAIEVGIGRMRYDAEARIKAGDDIWPPSVFEFACYCKTKTHASHREYKALPKPRANKEFAQEQIAKMREKL